MDDQEIFRRVMEGSDYSKEVTLPTQYGDLEFEMHPLERDELYDEANKLPPGLMGSMGGDGDEAEPDDMRIPDGDGVSAFVELCVKALEHAPDNPEEKLSETELRRLFNQVHDEVMFELAAEVVQLSMETGEIEDFRIGQ